MVYGARNSQGVATASSIANLKSLTDFWKSKCKKNVENTEGIIATMEAQLADLNDVKDQQDRDEENA